MIIFGNTCINTGIAALAMIIWNAATSRNLTGELVILNEYKSENFILGMNYFFFAYFFFFQPSEFNLVLMFMWISYKSTSKTTTTSTQEKEKYESFGMGESTHSNA